MTALVGEFKAVVALEKWAEKKKTIDARCRSRSTASFLSGGQRNTVPLSSNRQILTLSTGDHGFRVAGEARNHRTYGVCVTYPKVMPSREGSRSASERGRSPQGDDADEEDKDATALTAAPLAETSGTAVAPGTVKTGRDEKGRGAPGQSPPRTRGGRRGRRGGGYKGGGSNGADVQVTA